MSIIRKGRARSSLNITIMFSSIKCLYDHWFFLLLTIRRVELLLNVFRDNGVVSYQASLYPIWVCAEPNLSQILCYTNGIKQLVANVFIFSFQILVSPLHPNLLSMPSFLIIPFLVCIEHGTGIVKLVIDIDAMISLCTRPRTSMMTLLCNIEYLGAFKFSCTSTTETWLV